MEYYRLFLDWWTNWRDIGLRDFAETDTHRQCCYPRCKKMVKKSNNEGRLSEAVAKFGTLASLCKKHARSIGRKND
jgi:hypothetical protein